MTTIAALAHMERRLEVVKRYEKPEIKNGIIICPKCKGDMFWETDMDMVAGFAGPGNGIELVCLNCAKRVRP